MTIVALHGSPPFDISDPLERVADRVRRMTAEIPLRIRDDPEFRRLEPREQIACLLTGVATALIHMCFAHVAPESRDDTMDTIIEYLPQARANAEAMIDESLARPQ